MRNYNRRPSIRERISRFMFGRYGIDALYYFLLGLYLALIIAGTIVRFCFAKFNYVQSYLLVSYMIYFLESVVLFYSIFRVMSRNIYKRQQENQKFLSFFEKLKKFRNLQKCKKRDKKTHVYKKCPSCKNNLRLPKEKGSHTVVCPCCKHRFNVKI